MRTYKLCAWVLLAACAFGLLRGQAVEAARLRTIGFEVGPGAQTLEGDKFSGNSRDTSVFRSGVSSGKFDSTSLNNTTFTTINIVTATNGPMWARCYMRFASFPTGTIEVFQLLGGGTNIACRLTSTGTLQLFNDVTSAQIGSDSAALTTGQWYRVELNLTVSASVGVAELQVDGTSVASGTNLNTGAQGVSLIRLGWVGPGFPGANNVMNVDDFAMNDNTGASQTSWPGSGKIVLLKPISDNARTGWVAGAGGTTSLFSAVSNTPPNGMAAASETNTSQVKDIVSSTTDNYDANLTSYSTAGLVATDTIALVQALCDKGDAGTLSARTGALKIVSNPVQSVEDTYDFNSAAAAVGIWATNWNGVWGVPQYTPSVTLATSPVLRVGKRTATTREVDVDFMGLYVEYTNAAASSKAHRPLLGVGF